MSEKLRHEDAAKRVEDLLHVCKRRGRILVLTQDNPDPDALASAAALRELIRLNLHKPVAIRYGGICGRAENRAMIDILRIGARRLSPAHLDRYATVCLVDSQPQAGNNILAGRRSADVVIDHHLLPKRRPWSAVFADVRPDYGATTTILYEYLTAARVKIHPNLATAMFYGIQSDTQDLGRESGPADIRAYQELFLLTDKRKLARIRHASVPAEYFVMLAESLSSCVVAGATVISCIHPCRDADMIAEVADRMMRLEGARTAVCYGVCGDVIHLSARSIDARGNTARRMKRVVRHLGTGGGHRTMAGGQIPVEGDLDKRLALIRARILKVFAAGKEPVPLLPPVRR
jgi:nanoRNase/pAp phosphatase (c-di-AMP/oligoRNAs hydrolase)